jgi:phosphatidyl-myo-inositol alpha-mannosyltransferase
VSDALRIALVCPSPWPPREDLAWRVDCEARALARRGHRVTVLASGVTRAAIVEGRRLVRELLGGSPDALAAETGQVRVIVIDRAIRTGPRRRAPGPFDARGTLEDALESGGFDVIHLHEPLAPSPALAAVRHADAVTAVTFHGTEALSAAAFLGPLVERALGRIDVRFVASDIVRRALAQVLPGDYVPLPAGADIPANSPGPADGLVVVARSRDRAGARFGLAVARALDADVGPITLLGPAEAGWRTRALVPKALRGRVEVIDDAGPTSWEQALRGGRCVLMTTADDVASPLLPAARASGAALIAPRGIESDDAVAGGGDIVVVPPFSLDAWSAAARSLLADPETLEARGQRARAAFGARSWDVVAAELEAEYTTAIARHVHAPDDPGTARVTVDLRLRPTADADPVAIADACRAAGLGAVVVAAAAGIWIAEEVARAGQPDLAVVIGQEIQTREGVIVGLFLTSSVPDGQSLGDTLGRIQAQGGVSLVPHPATTDAPTAQVLRSHADQIDCYEMIRPTATLAELSAARLAQRVGLLVTAGSGAPGVTGIGAPAVLMRPFHGPRDFLDALEDAELVRRARPRRGRRGHGTSSTTNT